MNLIVREAIMKDYEELNILVKEVHDLHVNNRPDVYVDTEIPLEYDYFAELLEKRNSRIFVVEDMKSEKLLGYSIVNIMNPKSISILKNKKFLYIDDIMVKSSFKMNGIGKRLFNHIKEFAKNNEVESIQLNVWSFNEDAIKFYEYMGMKNRNIRMEMTIE